MTDKLQEILKEIDTFRAESQEQVEKFRVEYVGRKGLIANLFNELKNAVPTERKALGQQLNQLKMAAADKFKTLAEELENQADSHSEAPTDLTLPHPPHELGAIHPISATKNEIIQIFSRIGFNLSDGPEIEDDWHNFTALNFPPNHPAREMQDTFFIEKNPDIALRTHTSSIQVRVMENEKPPIRTLSVGRVFRNEAISARAHCIFHQVEGLYVDKKVSFADLKQTLYYFVKEFFGSKSKIRFRPSYFPFTEPSAEVDISCTICNGKGCNVCKYTGWLEIAGSGLVDPNVLKNCGIDPEEYTGFAFGMGIERMTMLKFGIRDLRIFTENDIRFLRQFSKTV